MARGVHRPCGRTHRCRPTEGVGVLSSSELRRILRFDPPSPRQPSAAERSTVIPPRAILVTVAESFDATEADNVVINGVPVWRSEWKRTGARVRLTRYGERVSAPIYEAASGEARAQFAAVEVSNGVWLFALPRVAV